jgi:iron complex outermembrane recepter protein
LLVDQRAAPDARTGPPPSRAALLVALALSAGAPPVVVAAESTGLAEVRVTARRREERLLEVPDSITALSAAVIESSRISTLKDVAPRVSNFSIVDAQQPGVAHLCVRGIGQTRNGEPPVAVVIDGVQLTSSYQMTQELLDVDRIEVLKGPQGAVYGRNALGGAILVTTRSPSNELEGSVRAGVGADADYTAGAMVSGAIVPDELTYRFAARGRSYGGDVASPNTPGRTRADELHEKDARLTLISKPSDRASFDLRLAHLETDSGAPWYTPVPPGGSPDAPRAYIADFPSRADRALTDAALKSGFRFERMQLSSVTAFSHLSTNVKTEADFTPADGQSAEQQLRADHVSQELRLASIDDARLQWLAGVYFLNTHQRFDTQVFLRTDFLPLFGLPPELSPFPVASARTTDSNDAYAGFGQLTYRMPRELELTLALRYDEDHRHQLDRGSPTPQVFEATFSDWQPKASLSWRATPRHMFYATAGKGFRSGGFNPQERITRVYRAETNWSAELGTKMSMLDNRVNLTAAVFRTRVEDRQVYTLDVLSSAQTLSNPIPRATVRGAEIELSARPIPALEVGAAIGLLKSRINRYDSSVFAGLPVAGDFTGNSLPQTPERTWSLQSQYRLVFRNGMALIPRVEWYGQGGDYFWEVDNANRRRAQDFLNVRLILERAAWTVSAYLENATNTQYVLEYLPSHWSGVAAGDISAAGRARHGGIEASYRF